MTQKEFAEVIADSIKYALVPVLDRITRLEASFAGLTTSGDAVLETVATIRRDVAAMGDLIAEFESSVKGTRAD